MGFGDFGLPQVCVLTHDYMHSHIFIRYIHKKEAAHYLGLELEREIHKEAEKMVNHGYMIMHLMTLLMGPYQMFNCF